MRVAEDPFDRFREWYEEACRDPRGEVPEAMCLSTVDEKGRPDARFVLLKGFDERGFVFYTNTNSPKARQMEGNPAVALTIYWERFRRQVRIRGRAEPVSEKEADEYFATRPRVSRLGAWASEQSQPLKSRFTLLRRVAVAARRFGTGEVPRPPFWSGYRVVPETIEFWSEGVFRLNDRIIFRRDQEGRGWSATRLYP